MKLKYLALLASSTVFLSACAASAPVMTPAPSPMVQASPIVIKEMAIALMEQNDLGQSGTAVISEGPNGNAVVTLTLSGGKFTTPQPAHIHLGSCPAPGAVKYPLTDVVDGKSVTTLDASYEDLTQATDKMAINIHKSAQESKIYTACGDLN